MHEILSSLLERSPKSAAGEDTVECYEDARDFDPYQAVDITNWRLAIDVNKK